MGPFTYDDGTHVEVRLWPQRMGPFAYDDGTHIGARSQDEQMGPFALLRSTQAAFSRSIKP